MLRDSYYLPFSADLPPLTSDSPLLSYSHCHPLFQELTSQVQALLAKGTIEQTDFSPGFYSRLFLAPKQNGDWRPVIDLSALNRYLSSPHFRMETVHSVMQSLPLGAWCTSIDLKDTFLHVPIAHMHRKYLRFRIEGTAFQFRALPFGLTTSPLIFTHIVKTVGAYAHSQGLNMLLYLDDWNISAPSPTLCARWTEWVLGLTASLGLIPNLPKCDLTPSQQFVFIGIAFNLNTGTARPAPDRVANFLRLLRDFLSSRAPPVVKWQRLLGHMTSLEKLTRRGRLHMHPVQFTLLDQWSQSSDPPLLPVDIMPSFFRSYGGGLFQSTSPQECPSTSPCQTYVCSPSPSARAGGSPLSHQIGGLWDSAQKHLHINVLELLAVCLALQHFLPLVQGQPVMVMTDNTTVVAQLHNQGGNAVKAPLQPHCPTAALGRQSQHQLSAPSHSGQAECYSRPLVTPSSGPQLRVDPVTSGSPSGLASVGPTPCGHVRHSRQHTPAHVRLSTSRPPGMADRRLILHLDGPLDLPVSSVPSSTGSSTAHKSHSLPGDSDCPSVAVPALVSPAAETPLSTCHANSHRPKPFCINRCHGCSTRSPCVCLLTRGVYQVRSPTKGVFSRRGTQNCFSTLPVNTVCLRQQVETFL